MENHKKEHRVERFQFVLTVNNNLICQRYFKINGFNEEGLKSVEFKDTMDAIVEKFKDDLASKSRTYLWYSDTGEPMKLTGFADASDTTYCNRSSTEKDMMEWLGEFQPAWKVVFNFTLYVDERPVYTRIWDGGVYPRYVRDSVDITNKRANYENIEQSRLTFSQSLNKRMSAEKPDLSFEAITMISDVLGYSFNKNYEYTHTQKYGDKVYDFSNRGFIRKLENEYYHKTRKHLDRWFPNEREFNRIDRTL